MNAMACTHPRQLGSMMLVLMLGASAASAHPGAQEGPVPLTTALKAGDTIAVTRWSGAKVKGQVLETTECSIVIRTGGGALDVPQAAIKTVRRYPPRKQNLGAKGMLAVAEQCQEAGCAPAALAYVGLAALFQAFRDLGRGPKIVYRGERHSSNVVSCSPGARVHGAMRGSGSGGSAAAGTGAEQKARRPGLDTSLREGNGASRRSASE